VRSMPKTQTREAIAKLAAKKELKEAKKWSYFVIAAFFCGNSEVLPIRFGLRKTHPRVPVFGLRTSAFVRVSAFGFRSFPLPPGSFDRCA
jgi:hypothetical protein